MKPTVGRIVHYVNLGDKDGKYPPEVQAAIVTGVYRKDPSAEMAYPQSAGNNDPKEQGVIAANAVGVEADSMLLDLRVLYRRGEFDMQCVPFSPDYARGHWSWPPKV